MFPVMVEGLVPPAHEVRSSSQTILCKIKTASSYPNLCKTQLTLCLFYVNHTPVIVILHIVVAPKLLLKGSIQSFQTVDCFWFNIAVLESPALHLHPLILPSWKITMGEQSLFLWLPSYLLPICHLTYFPLAT